MPASASRRVRLAVLVSLAAISVYFVISSSDGLSAYFTLDDGTNVMLKHMYGRDSLGDVLGAALLVVTPAFRPLGGVYYFLLYSLAGFNPAPFHAVCLLLMLGNLWLAFSVLRLLSGSVEAGVLGALLIAHHPELSALRYNCGTIYEILCFLFYFLAVRCYFVWRREGRETGATTISWRRTAGLVALAGCAMDSKEMAMTLPATLLLMELIYFPPERWPSTWREIGRFAGRQGRAALLTGAFLAPAMAIKVLMKNPLSDDPGFSGRSPHQALEGMRHFFGALLYRNFYFQPLSTVKLIALWTALAGLAIALRSRALKFGFCFLVLGLLPVALISRRNGYMLYLPLMGWALYVACLFRSLRGFLARLVRVGPAGAAVLRAVAFAAAAIWIVHTHAVAMTRAEANVRREQENNRRFLETLRNLHPQLPHGASLLILDDPLPRGYELLLLARMAYFDPTLMVERGKSSGNAVMDFDGRPLDRLALAHYNFILGGGWDLRDLR